MEVGPWLAVGGRTPAGVVAVLVDDVLAYAITEDEPPGMWSVSAEITLDLLRPLPPSGDVHMAARLVHADSLGGVATGTLTGANGTVLALASQRGRYIKAPDDLVGEGGWGGPPAPGDLDRLLAARADVPMATTDALANESDSLHGGVSMFLSDVVAGSLRPDLVTASLRIAYTRTIPIGAEVTWRAEVRHPGRSLAVVDVDGVVDGRICTTSRVILQPPA
jgi:acyl-coenzyme A thioesterase PaaI-like protein